MLLSIDPGTTESAWILYDDDTGKPVEFDKCENAKVIDRICELPNENTKPRVVIEMVASYGQPVGREVFETCLWIGRFFQACEWRLGATPKLLYRNDVKLHLCYRTSKINDAVIRQALLDRFGPGKEIAVGTKKKPGPLFGIKGDEWAALAVAVTFADQNPI